MYGQIHCVIRELVQTKFGNEAWETVLRKSQLDEHSSFLVFTRYDDVSTFSLVKAVSDTLGVPVEAVLEIFGEFFFDYCLRHGYDKMLRTLGSDIKSFIQNLDSLHSLLALSYKGISAPSFRCEDGQDGELILHYYSCRPGLYPIVKGVVKAVARDLFEQSVEMTIIEQNKEDIGGNQSQEHTAFRVLLRTESRSCMRVSPEGSSPVIRGLIEFNPEKVLLRATDFCSAFPYHIIFDRDLRIRQCGDLVRKHSSVTLTEGMPLIKAFTIVHPKMVVSIENIRKFINAVFLLAIAPKENGKKTFLLKGQMIWIADTQNMIFIGSPRLTSLNELIEMNVYLADIPLYDVTRELVLLNQQRIAEIDIAKQLDETTAELKKTSHALEEEKSKTETLLHQMLPRKVATALTHGLKVEAEKFDQVTILFSDIVTFTNIASACSPMDIVNLLNDMYQRFDARTSQHNVYKVETIGDAYMIVSGVPEKTTDHAQPVAKFAMDMVEDAGLVRSPATGLPLQIRVGVHTGPVVAGVVGVKMPRYCLFGDTVNTASRMESHGVPGRIHISPTTYEALRGWGYVFKRRGQMEVKGKGMMSTYFLCGHLDRRLKEPQDDFTELEMYRDSAENGDCVKYSPVSHDILDDKNKIVHIDKRTSTDEALQSPTDYNGRKKNSRNSRTDKNQEISNGSRSNLKNESSQTVVRFDGQSRIVRMKKNSQSSSDSIQLVHDQPMQDGMSIFHNDNATKTADAITSSGTQTSLTESSLVADCVYISGSIKNDYHEIISLGNNDGSGRRPQSIEDNKVIPYKKDHIISDTTTASVPGNIKANILNRSTGENCDAPATYTCNDRNKHTTKALSPTSLTSSVHGNSMSKSETFPLPSSGNQLPHSLPPSGSQGHLTLRTDAKTKRGKKHHSKLCLVA